MADPLLAVIRFALFAVLMATVGVTAFNLYALNRAERDGNLAFSARNTFQTLALLGAVASVIGMLMVAAGMDGVSIVLVRAEMIRVLVLETEIGTAGIVRIGALILALSLCLTDKLTPTALSASVGLLSSVALASLIWTGHAGATEASLGALHRVSDIIHMIAAALWLGGIAAHYAGDEKLVGWVEAQWARPTGAALDAIVQQLKALKLTMRNVPLDAAPADGACFFTGEKAVERILIGRTY